jgi:adenylosuccinate lyase
VPAQVTTLGKRFATWGEELLYAYFRLQEVVASYPLRGVSGAVGTGNDLSAVLGGKPERYQSFQEVIREHLQAERTMASTGQIYPRSLDFHVVSTLSLIAAAPSSFATTIRLLAGAGLVSEGFGQGQVGSSAMPHKMNARSCERINGLNVVLKGFVSMLSDLTGTQWYEGDVSCSVVRRIALPNSFYAIDGLLDTTIRVSDELNIYEDAFVADLADELPLLATGRIMAAAVKAGVGREDAHEIIGEQARALLVARRSGEGFSLARALAKDERLRLSESAINEIIDSTSDSLGLAADQVAQVVEAIASLIALHPSWVKYQPGESV